MLANFLVILEIPEMQGEITSTPILDQMGNFLSFII